MFAALLQMALLLVVGAVWRRFQPGGFDTDTLRRAITTLVFYLLLPALVLDVMWQAPIGWDTVRIAAVAATGVGSGLLLGWLITRLFNMPAAIAGAALLAAAFPNATYLGLPVLEASFGTWARGVAIQYDLLACTPLLMSVGMLIAQAYGRQSDQAYSALRALIQVPALWAMLLALVLNALAVPVPDFAAAFLNRLGACVIPLMLLALGMSLRWQGGMQGKRLWLLAVISVQLLFIPMVAWLFAGILGLHGLLLAATVVEAAMPSMVLGIVICDRYKLDTSFYAAAVTASTFVSLASLPLWLHVLTLNNGL